VLAINRETDDVLVEAKRVARGRVKEWFNYTYIAKL
jgi:enhancing lycopene biosynthesis protein 2